jgi:hypothetical protein
MDDKDLFELSFLLDFVFSVSFPSTETLVLSRVLSDLAACFLLGFPFAVSLSLADMPFASACFLLDLKMWCFGSHPAVPLELVLISSVESSILTFSKSPLPSLSSDFSEELDRTELLVVDQSSISLAMMFKPESLMLPVAVWLTSRRGVNPLGHARVRELWIDTAYNIYDPAVSNQFAYENSMLKKAREHRKFGEMRKKRARTLIRS